MAISDHYPETTVPQGGGTLYRYNVTQEQIIDPLTRVARTQYRYDEVRIHGKVTSAKVIAAIRDSEAETAIGDVATAIAQYTDAKGKLKTTKVKTLSVPELSVAVAQIMDYLGIEYVR